VQDSRHASLCLLPACVPRHVNVQPAAPSSAKSEEIRTALCAASCMQPARQRVPFTACYWTAQVRSPGLPPWQQHGVHMACFYLHSIAGVPPRMHAMQPEQIPGSHASCACCKLFACSWLPDGSCCFSLLPDSSGREANVRHWQHVEIRSSPSVWSDRDRGTCLLVLLIGGSCCCCRRRVPSTAATCTRRAARRPLLVSAPPKPHCLSCVGDPCCLYVQYKLRRTLPDQPLAM
jgi:hypothetical protein